MKYLIAILILIAGFILTPLASAADLIVSRAILEDKNGNLSIADVAGREFKPVGPTVSRGFTDSVHWLRLRVRAPVKGNEVVLFIRQPFLNEIRLYEPGAGPVQWNTRVTGNYYPYKDRDRARKTLGFVVTQTTPEATYYLRLKTKSVSQLSVEALAPGEADLKDNQLDLLEVFFVTAMLFLLLWALHSYLLDRLPVVGLFAAHQGMYTLYGVAITGYLAPLIPAGYPQLVDLSSAIPYCTVGFTTLLFCRALFRPYDPPAPLMVGLNLFLLVFPVQLAAMALGYTSIAVIINSVLVRICWWYFVIMTFSLRREQSPSRRVLQIFFVTITLVFTLFWIVSSSPPAVKNSLFGRQVLIINGIMIGGIFAMILNARSRRLLLEAKQAALELQAKSEFLALVSHEIRTPLNALVGFSSLARTATDPVKIDQYHSIIEQSSCSLMDLVNGILDMSKIEAGRLLIESVPFNLRQLVASLEDQYGHLAIQKKLNFQVLVDNAVPAWVMGDPVRVRQILVNLLSNAVKFTESGKVTCSVSLADQAQDEGNPLVRFEVRDTGIGIPEANRELLFQPFRQLDPTISRKFGGSGLGLAIVQSLAVMMNGGITVESREGAGSCFIVELPFETTEERPADLPTLSLDLVARAVLVVEDNNFNRQLLAEILTSWGHQVTLAKNGWQALLLMEQQSFDLVLLDIRMPDIDGIEVARRVRLRENDRTEAAVPIIAITADADPVTREACLGVGINTVLSKPIVPEQLARAMAEQSEGTVQAPSGEELLLNISICSDLGSDPERLRQYREMLLQDIADELQCLQAALENDDRNEIGRAAHTLKGLCGNLANREPAELAAWVQQNAPSARPEQMRQVIGQLRAICHSILAHEGDQSNMAQ